MKKINVKLYLINIFYLFLDFKNALTPQAQESNIPKDFQAKKPEYSEQEKVGEGLTRPESELTLPEELVNRKREETEDFHKLDSKKEQKRRKKSLQVEEKTEETEPVLAQQENTITYAEYLEQLKKKNENLNRENKSIPQTTSKTSETSNVEYSNRAKDTKEYGQWIESLHQKKKKPKEKKVDSTEDQINKLVGHKLILGPERRSYPETKGDINKEAVAGKFARPNRSSTDFPEL
jgi:hypothetical protein